MKWFIIVLWIPFLVICCSSEYLENIPVEKNLTIFFVNDQHGQLENFSKIKYIVDQAKKESAVIVACGGDIFSGNPVVDNHDEKGFPIIDVMNQSLTTAELIISYLEEINDQVYYSSCDHYFKYR